MRPPAVRPSTLRAQSTTPSLNGRVSPAESVASVATNSSKVRSPTSQHGGTKRKERDFEQESGQETNINVVVRCRGRNDREVRENSGVVVSTSGMKGNNVELSMGPSALSNKTYHFDKVFSPAADQSMIFDEVVAPILDEVCEQHTLDERVLTKEHRCCRVLTVPYLHTVKREPVKHTQCLETYRIPCPYRMLLVSFPGSYIRCSASSTVMMRRPQ